MDTTSDIRNMETIEIASDVRSLAIAEAKIVAIEKTIGYARYLNKWGERSASHPLPGTDFLHGMLQEKIISNDLYIQLVRLAEDPTMEYEIKIISE
jgi:hypothetical protein